MSMDYKLDIMIVDDDRDSLDGLEFSLTTFGHRVKRFCDPANALVEYKKGRSDVVITDYKMAEMNGLELLENLRNHDRNARVILVTAFGTLHMVKDALNKKASYFLTKPIDVDELFSYLDVISDELQEESSTPPVFAADTLQSSGDKNTSRIEDSFFTQLDIGQVGRKNGLKGTKILLIEDNLEITSTFVSFLNEKGFILKAVATGQQGWEQLNSGRYDLCLLDINLPDISGLAVVERIRKAGHKMIPCIALSGQVNNDLRLRCLAQGITEVLSKPFTLAELNQTIERMLLYRYQNFITPAEMVDITNNQVLTGMNSLISTIEARDNYTRGHSETVANVVATILTYHNFANEDVARAYVGARLHDVGKIGIKDSVLLKKAPLTEEEYTHIQQHPIIGTHIINGLPGTESLVPIILMHHERYDGMGYPFGLHGREIPFLARMTAVADTFDAITSERSYRKKRTLEQALEIIRDVQGRQLCPEAVKLFFEWISQSNVMLNYKQA